MCKCIIIYNLFDISIVNEADETYRILTANMLSLRRKSSLMMAAVVFFGCICLLISMFMLKNTNHSKTLYDKDTSNFYDNIFYPSLSLKSRGVVKSCREQTNFVFIKGMKCATETLGSVFRRFGYVRNLTFVTPLLDKLYLGWPFQITKYDYRPSKRPYNIIMEHAIYNKTLMEMLMPKDTLYITIIREPYSHFKSVFNYFNFKNIANVSGNDPLTEYLHNLKKYEDIYKSHAASSKRYCIPDNFPITKNLLSHCLGMPLGFPSGTNNITSDENAVERYIQQIHKEFSLVMIMEYFIESLILLKRTMCWSFKDIFYWNSNSANYTKKFNQPSKENVKIYRKWSGIDYKLYDHFNKTFWQKIKEQTPDFFSEVQHFTAIHKKVVNFCTSPVSEELVFNKTLWSDSFVFTANECKMFKQNMLKAIQKRFDEQKHNLVAPKRKKGEPNTPLC